MIRINLLGVPKQKKGKRGAPALPSLPSDGPNPFVLLVAMLGVGAAIFAVQNPDLVAVHFLSWRTVELPVSRGTPGH